MRRISAAVFMIALMVGALVLGGCPPAEREPIRIESEFVYALTGSYGNNSSRLLKIDSASREFLEAVDIVGFATKVRVGDHVYVSNGERITVYDKDLNKLAAYEAAITDFDTYGSYLYALGDNALDVIDFADPTDPVMVSSLSFNKTGHDIVFEDNKLYVLDNIMWPIYLYLVDVSDPQTPELSELEMWGVNVHLRAQEVTDRWFVIEVATRMFDRSVILRVFGATPPIEEISSITLSVYCPLIPWLVEGVDTGVTADIVNVGNYVYISMLRIPVPGFWGDVAITECDLDLVAVELKDLETIGQRSRLRLERRKAFDPTFRPPLVRDGDLLYYGGTEGIWLVDIRNPAKPSTEGIITTDFPVVSLELGVAG